MATVYWTTVALMLVPGLALGQTVATFDRLADRLNAGDRVRIVDAAGREHVGAIVMLGAEAIALERGRGGAERFARADVREVWARRHDSVRNGALIGFASLGVTYCISAIRRDTAIQCGIPTLFLGGLGAGAGALVDALIVRKTVVFRASAPVTLRLQPRPGGLAAGAVARW